MNKVSEHLSSSERLVALVEDCRLSNLNIQLLLTKLSFGGHSFVVLIFSLPFLLPIPIPGLSVLLGVVITISGLAITFGKPMWLPKFIADRDIEISLIEKIFLPTSRLLKKVEFLFKPRLTLISHNLGVRALSGLIIVASGILLFLPLPPGANFPPALVCALIAIGLLESDGLFLLIGFGAFALKVFLIFKLYKYFSEWAGAYNFI